MSKKIIGERLQYLLDQKKCSKTSFAELAFLSRVTVSRLCNDKYEKPLTDYTVKQIRNALIDYLGYGAYVMDYLFGEIEFNDIDDFSSDSTPARMYRASELIDDILKETHKAELLDDRIHYRVYGADHNDYIDMNIAEYQGFKYHLLRQIESSCQNYIDVCKLHDDRTDQRVLH